MGQGSDPVLRELLGLQARIYRLFDERAARARVESEAGPSWAPSVDIFETADALVLLAELPGVDPDGIGLEVAAGRLILRGERPQDTDGPDVGYHRVERPHGPFERVLPLAAEVDAARARASYRDGVLRVTLPKRGGSPPRAASARTGG